MNPSHSSGPTNMGLRESGYRTSPKRLWRFGVGTAITAAAKSGSSVAIEGEDAGGLRGTFTYELPLQADRRNSPRSKRTHTLSSG